MTKSAATAHVENLTDLHRDFAGMVRRDDAAVRAAEAAARAAGVQVRAISALSEFEAVSRLYGDIWRPDPTNPPVTTEWLRAFTSAGNYVAAAFELDELIGACVGFFGPPAGKSLHSHIAGVSGRARGRNVGFALKVHQRAWAMLRGVSTVAWTFDPLLRRNAHFNLVKLAARPVQYLSNFYGGMRDAINGGDDSDRLLVRWTLDAPAVVAACHGTTTSVDVDVERAHGAVVALGVSALGRPVVGRLDARVLLVAVPSDIERLRVSDPGCAKDWRLAVREVLGGLLADGVQITGFDRAGWYRLNRAEPANGDRP